MATATFEVRKFRDIEVVVNKADPERPINLTKLAASLTGSSQTFKHLLGSKSFWKLIWAYTGKEGSVGKPTDLETLVSEGVLVFQHEGTPNDYKGVYGPTWLADWIVINFKPEFFKQIHELFEVVERVAELKKRKFRRRYRKTY